MTNIDQFESVFKAADKPAFSREAVEIRSIMTVTDQDSVASDRFQASAKTFLKSLGDPSDLDFNSIAGDQFSAVSELLRLVEEQQPDLICTYRNLHIPASEYPHSLGVYVDVLTQTAGSPVLLLPHPARDLARPGVLAGTRTVMAVTDHLAGDDHLVSVAAALTEPGGKLLLAHVEDEQTFQRYLQTIAKIPAIDTETAREAILDRLLKEPRDFIQSCRGVLATGSGSLTVEEIVTVGHHLSDYKRLVDEHEINLLVLNTKDEDQLAMHGLAYPLSVELRETPLLLL